MGVLDIGKLRGALILAGLRGQDDEVGDCAVFAQVRLNGGADMPLAVWCAVRDVRRGRRPITNRDFLRWGSCADWQGVGAYRLADGSRVRYAELMPGELASEVSRECEPWVTAAVNELG